jgi:hypothetical protein
MMCDSAPGRLRDDPHSVSLWLYGNELSTVRNTAVHGLQRLSRKLASGTLHMPPSGAEVRTGVPRWQVHYQTCLGQELLIGGSHQALGRWDSERAIQMMWTPGDIWLAEVELPAGSVCFYKCAPLPRPFALTL